MNEKNLKPQSEIARADGRASALARKERKERREAIIAALKIEPLSPEDGQLFSQLLLNANNEELRAIATNEDLPTYLRRQARLLVGQDDEQAVEMAEYLLDRAFGKPK